VAKDRVPATQTRIPGVAKQRGLEGTRDVQLYSPFLKKTLLKMQLSMISAENTRARHRRARCSGVAATK